MLAMRVRAEQVAIVYNNTPAALFAHVSAIVLISVVIWPTTSASVIGIGLGLLLTVSAMRFQLFMAFRHAIDYAQNAASWERRAVAAAAATGLCWAGFGIFLVVHSESLQLSFIVFVLGGMVAGATSTLGAIRNAYLAFSLPIMLAMIGGLLWRVDTVSLAMAGLTVGFEVVMIGVVQRFNALFRRDIELRLTNEELVQSLTASAENLARTNADLETEIAERIRAQTQIEFFAHHDPLTGLPNRLLQHDRFSQAVARASRTRIHMALLFIDLDRFKEVNDSFGHSIGDALLRVVAERLSDCLRAGDSVCRHGGDEFLLLLGEVSDREVVATIAERVLKTITQPVTLETHQISIGCSIGISMYPDDGEDFDILIHRADAALYRAKNQGRGIFCFFSAGTDDVEQDRTRK
jgi:diguanylate cyclase (GGDEF)-like protein